MKSKQPYFYSNNKTLSKTYYKLKILLVAIITYVSRQIDIAYPQDYRYRNRFECFNGILSLLPVRPIGYTITQLVVTCDCVHIFTYMTLFTPWGNNNNVRVNVS